MSGKPRSHVKVAAGRRSTKSPKMMAPSCWKASGKKLSKQRAKA